MEISNIKRRLQLKQFDKVASLGPLSPQYADNSFSGRGSFGMCGSPKNFSFQRQYPETMRNFKQEKSSKPFIEFIRRMSKNECQKLYTETPRALNSTLKTGKASTTRRSQTEPDQSASQFAKEQNPNSRISALDVTKQKLPISRISKQEDLEITPSEFGGSVMTVMAMESDLKYLQKLMVLKDEEISILKKEKEIMTKRYLQETEKMQDQVQDLRMRVGRFEDGSSINISAEIDKVKRELHQQRSSKTQFQTVERHDSIKEVVTSEESEGGKSPIAQRKDLRLSIIEDTQKLAEIEQVHIPLTFSSEEDKDTLIKKLTEYDQANRDLTKKLAVYSDKLAAALKEKLSYETIIFQLQNESLVFQKMIAEQKNLLEKYDIKRAELNKTLKNLRKYN